MSEHRWTWVLAAILAAGVSIAAASSQSLWIDEANSAMKAVAPSFEGFLQAMRLDRGSDLQMPLYMVMLWAWEKGAGHSEFALRAMNIPLFVAAVGIVAAFLKQPASTRLFFALFACTSAFIWAYLDEARPYILQFFAASLLMVACVNTANGKNRPSTGTLAFFGAGALILCGSSLIGVIFTAFYLLAFLLAWRHTESVVSMLQRRDAWIVAILSGIPLVLLAGYYFWTLSVGAKASSVGVTNAASFGFCLYESFGFGGFGPGRNQLRESPIRAAAAFLPFLGIYAMALVIFLSGGLASLMSFRHIRRTGILIIPACVAAAVACLLLVGVAGGFRVVGRHLMPAMPFVLLGLAILAQALWVRRTPLSRGVVVCTLALMLASAIIQGSAPRYAKDDYRAAAAAAQTAMGDNRVVWWAADRAAADYYQVFPRLMSSGENTTVGGQHPVFMANNRDAEYLGNLPKPTLVILSKPDIYDAGGHLRKFLADGNYKLLKPLASFTLYSSPE